MSILGCLLSTNVSRKKTSTERSVRRIFRKYERPRSCGTIRGAVLTRRMSRSPFFPLKIEIIRQPLLTYRHAKRLERSTSASQNSLPSVFPRKCTVCPAIYTTHMKDKILCSVLTHVAVECRIFNQLSLSRLGDSGHRLLNRPTAAPIPSAFILLPLAFGKNTCVRDLVSLRNIIRNTCGLSVREVSEGGVSKIFFCDLRPDNSIVLPPRRERRLWTVGT